MQATVSTMKAWKSRSKVEPMTTDLSPETSRWLTIKGELQSATFLPWVERHGHRLGLSIKVIYADPRTTVFKVDGQADLIDAFEIGCLLGPINAWVETITRRTDMSVD